MRDSLLRFVIEHTNVRGELVYLDETWTNVRTRRAYPAPVSEVLGQGLAATALLAATVKFDGSLTLQASGDGLLDMLVVQASGQRTLRGLARWQDGVRAGDFAELMGRGRLAITIDPGKGRERYQGLVELDAPSLARALDGYFERSEQLPTRLWLAASDTRAAGLLLQELPGEPLDPDGWSRCAHLAATLSERELLELAPEELLRRLFHEEDLRVYPGEAVRFACRCSRERVLELLRSLGEAETKQALEEQGRVAVQCEFCGEDYRFDAVDVEQIFAADEVLEAGRTRH